MRIDAFATQTHWFDHVAAVWKYLEPDERGTFYMGSYNMCGAASRNAVLAEAKFPPRVDRPILCASWADASRALRVGRPVILMEHGVGQSFNVKHPSYSGANEHAALRLRLAPNEHAARTHRASKASKVPVEVVGVPKMDDLVALHPPPGDTVALSNHWGDRNTLVPEMGGAWFEWHQHYLAIPARFPGALGHAHPKLWPKMHGLLAEYGFEPVEHFSAVCRRASVYVCDGVSTLYEFAALDRPVVVLNPPQFRRDVHHGGRFWDWADIGVQVSDPDAICDAIMEARADRPEQAARRREITTEVFPYLGQAGLRAVAAMRSHFD